MEIVTQHTSQPHNKYNISTITNVKYSSLHGYNNKVGKDELVTEEKPLFAIFNYESKSKFGAERLMYPISAGFPFRFVSSK